MLLYISPIIAIMLGINYYDQLQYYIYCHRIVITIGFGLANYNNIATYQIHVSIDAVLKQSVIMKLAKINIHDIHIIIDS